MKTIEENTAKTPNKVILFLMLVFIIVVILLIYVNIDKGNTSFDSTNVAMGTYVNQTVYGNNAEEISKEAMNKISEIEDLLSSHLRCSPLCYSTCSNCVFIKV